MLQIIIGDVSHIYASGLRLLIPLLLTFTFLLCARAYLVSRSIGYVFIGIPQAFALILSLYCAIAYPNTLTNPKFPVGLVCYSIGLYILLRREVKIKRITSLAAKKAEGVDPNRFSAPLLNSESSVRGSDD